MIMAYLNLGSFVAGKYCYLTIVFKINFLSFRILDVSTTVENIFVLTSSETFLLCVFIYWFFNFSTPLLEAKWMIC